jgi:hypothetical protein
MLLAPAHRATGVMLASARGWVRALPRAGDLAGATGALGEWLGHASLDPARVLGRASGPASPTAPVDVVDDGDGAALARLYAAVGALQAGASGLITGVVGGGGHR